MPQKEECVLSAIHKSHAVKVLPAYGCSTYAASLSLFLALPTYSPSLFLFPALSSYAALRACWLSQS